MNTVIGSVDFKRAQKLASAGHVAAIVAAVLLALTIIGQYAVPAVQDLAEDGSWGERVSAALTNLTGALPLAFFLSAALRLRMALDHYTDGFFFAAKPARHLARAGVDVVMAVVAQALIVPLVHVWTRGEHGDFALNVEPEMVGVLAFALGVMVVGRILEAAAAIKAENDQIV